MSAIKLNAVDSANHTKSAFSISRKIVLALTFLKAKYKSNTARDNSKIYLRTDISLNFMEEGLVSN